MSLMDGTTERDGVEMLTGVLRMRASYHSIALALRGRKTTNRELDTIPQLNLELNNSIERH